MNYYVSVNKSVPRIASCVLAGVIIVGLMSGCAAILGGPSRGDTTKTADETSQVTAITNAKIFDGENLIPETVVVIKDGIIEAAGGEIPEGVAIIDAEGCMLMPGLIDSHAHMHDVRPFPENQPQTKRSYR